ncbi:MAG: hypothetical protein U1F43_00710 [Myxococcota bacterium]
MGSAIVALAVLLAAPSIGTGYQADDFMLQRGLSQGLGNGFRLFDHPGAAERAAGLVPWWASEDLRIAFFRPLAELTHAFDQAVAPGSAAFAHVHNLAWFAAMLAAALALLRRLVGRPWLAHLALVVYAIDDARGPAVGWIANRNGLMAAAFGFLALWAHDRWRRGSEADRAGRGARLLAPLAFALALLSGEIGVSTGALLLAYALVYERGRWWRRLAPLWPYAALGAAWLAAHHLGGYGTFGQDGYLDPLSRPLAFLGRVATVTPALLGGALGVWSDFLPAVAGVAALAYVAVDCAVIAIWALFFRSLWQRFEVVRFGLLGSLLGTLPLAGGAVTDRYLVFVSLGVAIAAAVFLGQVPDPSLRSPRQTARVYRHLIRPTALITTCLWIGGGALGLPSRARSMVYVGAALGELEQAVQGADDGRRWFAVTVTSEAFVDYLPLACAGPTASLPAGVCAGRDATRRRRVAPRRQHAGARGGPGALRDAGRSLHRARDRLQRRPARERRRLRRRHRGAGRRPAPDARAPRARPAARGGRALPALRRPGTGRGGRRRPSAATCAGRGRSIDLIERYLFSAEAGSVRRDGPAP